VNSTLYAGGTEIVSQVTVDLGALLKGTGTINAVTTTVSGTLSPGNSIGTLHYTAPLIVPGTLLIEIAPGTNNNSRITSTSTVDLTGGTVQIVADPGTYTAGTQYILVSSTGFSGMPSLLMPPSFLGQLDYPGETLILTLLSVPLPGIDLTDLTGNSLKLANYLNNLGTSFLGSSFTALEELSSEDQAEALLTLSPSRAAFARYGNMQSALSFSRLVEDRLSNARILRETLPQNLASTMPHSLNPEALLAASDLGTRHYANTPPSFDETKPYTLWISGFGGFLFEKGAHQNPSFKATNGGLLIALDKSLSENILLGGGLAYANSQIEEEHHFGHTDTQGGLATLYGTWFISDFFLDAALWAGFLHTHSHRNIFYPGFS
jgi:uncharacterized protein with beta-barrel porin domain